VFEKSAAALILKRTENIRQRGVVEAQSIGDHIYRVSRAVEKPESFPSKLAIEPVYLFRPEIFQALESISVGVGGEFQLTDAIDLLISQGSTVCAAELAAEDELFLKFIHYNFPILVERTMVKSKRKGRLNAKSYRPPSLS
jgi:UTP-glucose-1-phosphate uridylyltransferase